jgi:hypothetical protein
LKSPSAVTRTDRLRGVDLELLAPGHRDGDHDGGDDCDGEEPATARRSSAGTRIQRSSRSLLTDVWYFRRRLSEYALLIFDASLPIRGNLMIQRGPVERVHPFRLAQEMFIGG